MPNDAPETDNPSSKRGTRNSPRPRPWWPRPGQGPSNSLLWWGTVVGLLAAVVMVLTIVVPLFGGMFATSAGQLEPRQGPKDETAVVGPTATSAGESSGPDSNERRETNDPAAFNTGDCLQLSKKNTRLADCETEHNAQIIGVSGECTSNALLRFLGGTPDIDVVRADVTVQSGPDNRCIAALPEEFDVRYSLENALASTNSESFRQCYDELLGQGVGCEQPHTGEVVKVLPADSSGSLNCAAAAERYMGLPVAEVSDDLAVAPRTNDGDSLKYCLVSVKGSNSLTSTIRDLGNSSLPIQADDGTRQ